MEDKMCCFNYVNPACIDGRCPKCSDDYLTLDDKIAECNECFYYNACDDILSKKFIYEVELKYANPDPAKCLMRHFISVLELIAYMERAQNILTNFCFDYVYHAPSMKLSIVMFDPKLE